METRATTLRQLQRLLRTGAAGLVVNLAGPLGVGKTTLLDELGVTIEGVDLLAVDGADCRAVALADGGIPAVVIDGVDSGVAGRSLLAEVGRIGPGPVVVTSRLPLLSRAGWARTVRNLVTLTMPRWPDDEIEQLAARYRPGDAAALELVVTLSGGIPLIADFLGRTVAGGTPADWPGAVAGPAADEIVRRLECEHLTRQDTSALLALATVGAADEELLADLTGGCAEHSSFPPLSRLSITTRSAHGLTVKEPYRVLLDLAHRVAPAARASGLADQGGGEPPPPAGRHRGGRPRRGRRRYPADVPDRQPDRTRHAVPGIGAGPDRPDGTARGRAGHRPAAPAVGAAGRPSARPSAA